MTDSKSIPAATEQSFNKISLVKDYRGEIIAVEHVREEDELEDPLEAHIKRGGVVLEEFTTLDSSIQAINSGDLYNRYGYGTMDAFASRLSDQLRRMPKELAPNFQYPETIEGAMAEQLNFIDFADIRNDGVKRSDFSDLMDKTKWECPHSRGWEAFRQSVIADGGDAPGGDWKAKWAANKAEVIAKAEARSAKGREVAATATVPAAAIVKPSPYAPPAASRARGAAIVAKIEAMEAEQPAQKLEQSQGMTRK